MTTARRSRLSLRGTALLPAGALAVDMLRYALAYRGHAEQVFVHEGHGYLETLIPWIAAVLALAVGGFLTRFARAWRGSGGPERAGVSTAALWIVCSCALLVIHVSQEALELALIPGNTGLYELLGPGFVWAALAALVIGGALALALRGARALIVRAGRRHRGGLRRPAAQPRPARPTSVVRLLPAPLARAAAGRAPPPARAAG